VKLGRRRARTTARANLQAGAYQAFLDCRDVAATQIAWLSPGAPIARAN